MPLTWFEVLCCAKLLQLCLTLCGPMGYSPSGPSVHGILQTRIGLQRPPPGDLPDPRIRPTSLTSPALTGGSVTTRATWEALMWDKTSLILFFITFVPSVQIVVNTVKKANKSLALWWKYFFFLCGSSEILSEGFIKSLRTSSLLCRYNCWRNSNFNLATLCRSCWKSWLF